MSDEKYVRSKWHDRLTAGMDIYGYGVTLPSKPPHSFIGFEKRSAAWAAAAEFTRQREEEIRLIREEIEEVEHLMESGSDEVWERILARLNAEHARLTAGMQQVEGGR